MKKLTTDSKQFGALRMLDEFVQSLDSGLADQTAPEEFIKKLAGALQQHSANPIVVHGFRAQTMFAYLAAALGGCKIITEEDGGDFYVADPTLKRPDFRILTDEGKEFFVEAKNFNQTDPTTPFVLKAEYAHSLRSYAEAFQKPLLFAIYWVRWGLWTLTPFAHFSRSGETYAIELTEAMKNDEKALIGDCMIGIPKPLSLRFYTDPTKPRKVSPDGHAQFTIQRVVFVAAGRDIVDAFEMKLAGFFLYYGP
jgi:hypothetical protein